MSAAEPLPTLADLEAEDHFYLSPQEIDQLVAEQVEAGETDVATIVRARWVPASEGAANWAYGHLERLNGELAGIARHHRELMQRADAWFKARTKQAAARAAFFDAALKEYALAWQAEDDQRRTLHLPDGGSVVVTVPKAATITVGSEPEVLAWARAEASTSGPGPQDCIHTVADSLYVSEVRKWVKAVQNEAGEWIAVSVRSGALVPGLNVEPPKDPHARVVL